MRLGDMARITQRSIEENGPVITRPRHFTLDEVVEVVNQNPGMTAQAIVNILGLGGDPQIAFARVAGRMQAHIAKTRPKNLRLKRAKMNGVWCYYPKNYKLSTDKPDPYNFHKYEPAKAEAPKPPRTVEMIARDYVWETGADPAPLKAFIDWVRKDK